MRTALWLFVILVVAQLLLFQYFYQGTYYFLFLILILWRLPTLPVSLTAIWLLWLTFWIDTLGNGFGWYGRYNWYDDVSHAFAAFCIAFFFTTLIAPNFDGHHFALFLIGLALAMLVMSSYEVLEYWFERLTHHRFIWGEFDTTFDLQWDIVGSMVGAWLGTWSKMGRLKKAP